LDRKFLINETEEDGNQWTSMDFSSLGFDFLRIPAESTLWQASAKDQRRNFGMPSFVTVKDV
jgi:murein endopeptidase